MTRKIEELFKCVNERSTFQCQRVQDNPVAYLAETTIQLFGMVQPISISITYYPTQNSLVLLMFISEGYSGKNSVLVDQLLLRLNSFIYSGGFAIWPENGDIIFKQSVPEHDMSCRKLISLLEYFTKVYITVKPQLDVFASNFQLKQVSEEEVLEITKRLSIDMRNVEKSLVE